MKEMRKSGQGCWMTTVKVPAPWLWAVASPLPSLCAGLCIFPTTHSKQE